MKSPNKLAQFAFGLMLASGAISAQPKDHYKSVEVCQFGVPGDVGLPKEFLDHLMADLVSEIGSSGKFDRVIREGTAEELPSPGLRIVGQVTEFKKGSQAKRYLLGPGFGKTILKARIQFVDRDSGKVVFEGDVDGKVIMGMYGGESVGAAHGLAKEVAKKAKKTF